MKTRFVIPLLGVLFAAGASASVAQNSQPTPNPSSTPAVKVQGLPNASQVINDVVNDVVGRTTGAFGYNPNRADGTVTYFHRFDMQIGLQLGKYRNIHLHQGTIINPRGWSIQPGQQVDVTGHPDADGTLEADVIIAH